MSKTGLFSVLVSIAVGLVATGCVSYSRNDSDGGEDADGHSGGDPNLDACCLGDDGGPPDADALDGGDPDACVAPPQPVGLQIGSDPWSNPGGYIELVGEAVVLLHRRVEPPWTSEAWLWFTQDAVVIGVLAELPDGLLLPVRPMETLWARATIYTPWWVDYELVLRQNGPDGDLRVELTDGSFSWPSDEARCPPVGDTMGCGERIHPTAKFDLPGPPPVEVNLEQGDRFELEWTHLFMGRMYKYVTMGCADVPMGWFEAARIDNRFVSQCRCVDHHDCAQGFVCDTQAGRCVVDHCQVMDCPTGQLCDPYQGVCVAPPLGVMCDGPDSCSADSVCNPFTGHCLDDWCQLVDCAPCSVLIGRCYGCLPEGDCDCWPGICDPDTESCQPGCPPGIMQFEQANPDAFDMAILCVDGSLEGPAELLPTLIPGLVCGVSAPTGACDPALNLVCLVDLERASAGSSAVAEGQWGLLCAASRLGIVSAISGAHYLR